MSKSLYVTAALAGAAVVTSLTAPPVAVPALVPPCPTEDGDGNLPRCAYDATHRGNGEGTSFVTDRSGNTTPVPHWVAHRLLGSQA